MFEIDAKGDAIADATLATVDKAVQSPIIFELHRTAGDVGETSMACLLYTSPSPRDRTRSRMPSSA